MSLVFEAIQTEGLAEISYLIGDDEEGIAAVFDPRADVEDEGRHQHRSHDAAVPDRRPRRSVTGEVGAARDRRAPVSGGRRPAAVRRGGGTAAGEDRPGEGCIMSRAGALYIIAAIDERKKLGDTLGGVVEVDGERRLRDHAVYLSPRVGLPPIPSTARW